MLSLNWHAHDDSDNRGGRDMTYFQDKRLGNAMGNGFDMEYYPIEENVKVYQKLYDRCNLLGRFIESEM